MEKIKNITLENFKFFYGNEENPATKNTIELNRKNLLIYGENGSGKSSVYWGLYTFLQSVYKSRSEVRKYFNPENNQNLVNRFAGDGANSSVLVTFEDESLASTTRQISHDTINTKNGNIVKEAAVSSDFINYKYLSRLHDFRNSEAIDLFPIFEKDILMFVQFTAEFEEGNSNALDWYNSINKGLNPRPKMRDPEYIEYMRKLNLFNEELEKYIYKLIESANGYLQDDFKQPFRIFLNYYPCTYDEFLPDSTTKRNHEFLPPVIKLTIEYLHDKLNEEKSIIEKPHTFLNESRLTIIALSLRFAILEEKLIADAPKVLVLDDFLISLDMNKRDIILDVILKNFDDEFQLIVLSHDRFFLEYLIHKIHRHEKRDEWEYLEMYEDKLDDIPVPYITKANSHLEKAIKYLKLHEYDISGNFLRKAAEEFCIDYLPKHYQYKPDFSLHDLNGLIAQCSKFSSEKGIHSSLFTDLDSHRKFVLNPSSHHCYDIPKFKIEIEKCLQTVETLKKIKKQPIISAGTKLHFELTNTDSDTYKFDMEFLEELFLVKLPNEDSILTKGQCKYTISKNGTVTNEGEENVSIKTKYDKWHTDSDGTKNTNFWEEVILTDSGEILKALRKY